MLLEICVQIYSVVFALSRQIDKQKYAKTFNFLCASNKDFVKYEAQGGFLTPTNSPPLRTPLKLLFKNEKIHLTTCVPETSVNNSLL